MRSSTSNSDARSERGFIIKTLSIFISLTFLYYAVVSRIPKDLQGTAQQQLNIMKAQDYAFSDGQYPIMLVGSSMGYRVPLGRLSPKALNLAFGGGSSTTGLSIILKKGDRPDVLFVEVNDTLSRGLDQEIMDSVSAWRSLPFGREDCRPDYLFGLLLRRIRSAAGGKDAPPKDEEPRPDLLRGAQEAGQRPLSEEERTTLLENAAEVKAMVDALAREGTRIILIETPCHPSLQHLPRMEETRALLRGVLPEGSYEWLDVDWADYKTSDGGHLGPVSAERYARVLLQHIGL